MNACPYLVDVTADRLHVYPRGVFCRHPDGRIRLPGRATVATRCSGEAFQDCEGYQRFVEIDEAEHDGG